MNEANNDQILYLIHILSSGKWPAFAEAQKHLIKLGEPILPALERELHERVQQHHFTSGTEQIIEILGHFGDKDSRDDIMIVLSEASPQLRQAAAQALGKMKDPYAIESLIHAMLIETGDIEDITTRQVIITALVNIGEASFIPLCFALHHKNALIRAHSATALGQLGDTQATLPLIESLHDIDGQVRAEAAQALGFLKDRRALDPLRFRLQHDQWWYVRYCAAIALGSYPKADVFKILSRSVNDNAIQVRQGIISAIVESAGSSAIDLLLGLLEDPDPCIRKSAVLGLAKVGDEKTIAHLTLLKEDNAYCGANNVRDSVIYAIDQIRLRS